MPRYDYTNEVEDGHDRVRSPRMYQRRNTENDKDNSRSRGCTVAGQNRGEMKRYALYISSRIVHGDANVIQSPDTVTNVWIASLRPPHPYPRTSSLALDVCHERLCCVISRSSYTLSCAEDGLRGGGRNDFGLKSQPLPVLTVAEVPVCRRTCGLSESASGRLTLRLWGQGRCSSSVVTDFSDQWRGSHRFVLGDLCVCATSNGLYLYYSRSWLRPQASPLMTISQSHRSY